MTKIKICGLFRDCDADFINTAQPDFAGFVFYPPSHRNVSDTRAEKLRELIKPEIKTVGVFVNDTFGHITSLYKSGAISIIQLHGSEDNKFIYQIKNALPDAVIWKAFKIRSAADIKDAKSCPADRILLDNGYGTGQCFNWSLADGFNREFILAGGLTHINIHEAVERFRPWAVDISSGVETDKVKDLSKITAAVNAVRNSKL